jgi:hypothetical protein
MGLDGNGVSSVMMPTDSADSDVNDGGLPAPGQR